MAGKSTNTHDSAYDRWGYTPGAIKVVKKPERKKSKPTTKRGKKR